MRQAARHGFSTDEIQHLLGLPDLRAARDFLKSHPDLITRGIGFFLTGILDEVPMGRNLHDRCDLFARLAVGAASTDIEKAYADLSGIESGSRSQWDWMQLGLRFLTVENIDVAKALLKEYPEIPHAAVRAAGEAALEFEQGTERDRLQERLKLLDEWPRLTLMWEMETAQENESRLQQEPTIENLRVVTADLRRILGHSELLKLPPAFQIQVFERSVDMHYSLFVSARDGAALDRAINDARAALKLGSDGRVALLTSALLQKYEVAGNDADLDEVIDILVPIAKSLRSEIAPLVTTLANALNHRAVLHGGRADLDRAMELYEWLTGLPVDDPMIRQIRLGNLASGLMARYDNCADLKDLYEAIEILDELIGQISDQDSRKTTLCNNLGLALLKRSRDSTDLKRAQTVLSQSVNLLPQGSPELPRNLTNAGVAWLTAFKKTNAHEMLALAIRNLSQAADLVSGRRGESARTLNALSDALLQRFKLDNCRDDLDRALDYAEQAAGRAIPGSPFWLVSNAQRALVLQARGELLNNEDDFVTAAELNRATLMKVMDEVPLFALEASLAWGATAHARERWNEASEAYLVALDAHDRVLESQKEIELKEVRLKRVQGLGAMAARCLVNVGDLKGAVTALERGRAALVAEAIGRATTAPPVKLPAVWPDGAVVYLENVDRGFALVAIKGDVKVLELPELSEPEINEWLRKNMARRTTDPSGWATALDQICKRLWDVAIGPVLQSVAGVEQITVIPGGCLGMLPLHAAWREDAAALSGRVYAADTVSFRYAPNATVLFKPRSTRARTLLCVDEPQPVDAASLPFSAEEVAVACELFEKSEILKGEKATRSAALDLIPHSSALHLSCHGFANLQNPRQNGFLMSNGEFLTLDDLLALKLNAVELAFLSACDAGQMGIVLPDEAIGLPSGMLQSGVFGVISPLWPVTSWSTVLLVARFYELWRRDQHTPPEALRRAQLWLRDTTNEEKAVHFQNRPQLHQYLLTRKPKEREQQRIFSWAPFYYCGA